MPSLSRLLVRASFLHLLAGATIGVLLLIQKAIGLDPTLWRLTAAHNHVMLFGWMVQLVMGVAYWILPRLREPPVRGKAWPVLTAFILINAGPLLAGLAPFSGGTAVLSLAGRTAEAGAAAAFVLHAWPRVYGLDRPATGSVGAEGKT